MTRSLRRSHRRVVLALGIALPIAFAAGVAARRPVPTLRELPESLAASARSYESVAWPGAPGFTRTPTELHLLRERTPPSRLAIALSAPSDFAKPDLLVYWVTGTPRLTDALPGNATLLGGFDSTALPLPPEAATRDGVLVLYSLADNEIVDVSRPARFHRSNR